MDVLQFFDVVVGEMMFFDGKAQSEAAGDQHQGVPRQGAHVFAGEDAGERQAGNRDAGGNGDRDAEFFACQPQEQGQHEDDEGDDFLQFADFTRRVGFGVEEGGVEFFAADLVGADEDAPEDEGEDDGKRHADEHPAGEGDVDALSG